MDRRLALERTIIGDSGTSVSARAYEEFSRDRNGKIRIGVARSDTNIVRVWQRVLKLTMLPSNKEDKSEEREDRASLTEGL